MAKGEFGFIEEVSGPVYDENDDLRGSREAGDRLELFLRAIEEATDAIRILDPEGYVIYSNKSAEKMYGYSPGESIGRHLGDFTAEREIINETIPYVKETGSLSGELTALGKGGRHFPIWFSSSAVKNSQGEVIAIISIIRDITDRKVHEEQMRDSISQKELLLKEVHHRVKNNLQIISSLLSLQADYSADTRSSEMFLESRNRVKTMGLLHEKLYESGDLTELDLKEYIGKLIDNLIISYRAGSRVRTDLFVGELSLGIDVAIPVGLILNELISNSLKHAFAGAKRGEISISLRPRGNGEIELIVKDDGTGFPENLDIGNSGSLGLHLVSTLAERQLRGTMELVRGRGSAVRIIFSGRQ